MTIKKENLESVINHINDPAVKIVAEHSLKAARKALDLSEYSRKQYIVDEIEKIMVKALKKRTENETP